MPYLAIDVIEIRFSFERFSASDVYLGKFSVFGHRHAAVIEQITVKYAI